MRSNYIMERTIFFLLLMHVSLLGLCYSSDTLVSKDGGYISQNLFSIRSIKSSENEIEIRFLRTSLSLEYSEMIVLGLKNQEWIACHYKSVISTDTFYSVTPMVFSSKPDSLYKLLLSYNIHGLPSDDTLYNRLILHSSNGFDVPFLLPDDGVKYYIETKNNMNYTAYHYSNPNTIYKNLIRYNIDYNVENSIDGLTKFINILKIIHNEFDNAPMHRVFSQKNDIKYEQLAIDYLYDSIVKNKYCINFDGYSDSAKTVLINSCIIQFPIKDKYIKDYYKKEKERLLRMQLKNNYDSLYDVDGIVKLDYKGSTGNCFLCLKRRRSLKVFQHVLIGKRAYVWIRLLGKENKFNDFYFIDTKGNIIDYCSLPND